MGIIGGVVVFCVGVYVGKYHFDQFVDLVGRAWTAIKGWFKKDPPTTTKK